MKSEVSIEEGWKKRWKWNHKFPLTNIFYFLKSCSTQLQTKSLGNDCRPTLQVTMVTIACIIWTFFIWYHKGLKIFSFSRVFRVQFGFVTTENFLAKHFQTNKWKIWSKKVRVASRVGSCLKHFAIFFVWLDELEKERFYNNDSPSHHHLSLLQRSTACLLDVSGSLPTRSQRAFPIPLA